ncbi:MAG: metal ABC transporter permease [Rhodobacteraceae bacterium]|nr:metal ABC transporter permease [Paracoccaceae bacterium]
MLDDFMVRATLAGIAVAVAAAPLGCLVVWRRMAYFGDATAHASILGVALSLALSFDVFIGALAAALIVGLAVGSQTGRILASDTLLGVLAHSALSLGLVAIGFVQGVRVDLSAYLFGDILSVNRIDLALMWGGSGLILAGITRHWQGLLTTTMSAELAHAAGIDPRRENLVLTMALAVAVAVSIKAVGALLIAAMLIIPSAAARPFVRTPECMVLLAAGFGGVSVLGGLGGSLAWDTPSGPTIVVVASMIFVLSRLVPVRT